MPNKTVHLSAPVTGHRAFRELEFREPKWNDYTEIGDPYVWARSPLNPDLIQPMPMPERVKLYAERLLVEGTKAGDVSLLDQLNLVDSKKVEDAICGFFLAVDPRMSPGSTASGKDSSSTSSGGPATSETSPSPQ